MKRIAAALYGFVAYLAFLLPIGYLLGFLADLGLPKTVDRGAGPFGPPLAVDLTLLLIFGLQHSIMARPGFKRRVERWVPPSLERSTYVLVSGLTLALVFVLWRPIPAVLWDVAGTPLATLAWAGFAAGIGLAVVSTLALSHLHLFGVAQVAAYVTGREHPRLTLRDSLLYRIVRHPMTAGLMLASWSAPRMTVGHLLFAVGMTAYGLWGTVLEERDLVRSFQDGYRAYRMQVPALIPIIRPAWLPGRGRGLATEIAIIAAGIAALSLLLLGGVRVPATRAHAAPGLQPGTLRVNGTDRSYALFDPDVSKPSALILALHGSGGTGARLRRFLGGALERVAHRRGWLVAYPEAFEGRWNDCRRGSHSSVREAGLDDVAFLRGLIVRLTEEGRVDPDRVFLLGYSGGGHMAFRMALEAPETITAVAVFGANVPDEAELLCRAAGSIPAVMLVNGTHDPVNPWEGGDVITPLGAYLGRVRSARQSARYLERLSSGRAPVRLVAVPGGGHSVPGHASRFPALVGRTDRTYQGVEEAALFFGSAAVKEWRASRGGG